MLVGLDNQWWSVLVSSIPLKASLFLAETFLKPLDVNFCTKMPEMVFALSDMDSIPELRRISSLDSRFCDRQPQKCSKI